MADPQEFKCGHFENAIPHWNQWQNMNIFAKNSPKCCFAGEKILRSSDFVTDKEKNSWEWFEVRI